MSAIRDQSRNNAQTGTLRTLLPSRIRVPPPCAGRLFVTSASNGGSNPRPIKTHHAKRKISTNSLPSPVGEGGPLAVDEESVIRHPRPIKEQRAKRDVTHSPSVTHSRATSLRREAFCYIRRDPRPMRRRAVMIACGEFRAMNACGVL